MSKKRIRVIGLFIAVLSLAVLSGCGSAKKKQKATTKTTEVASTTEKEKCKSMMRTVVRFRQN